MRHFSNVRVLDTRQLAMLLGLTEAAADKRLQRLRKAGFVQPLARQELFLREHSGRYAGRTPRAYALTSKGAVEVGAVTDESGPRQSSYEKNNRALTHFQIEHSLMIASVYTSLTAACRQISNLELSSWSLGDKVADTFHTDENGRVVTERLSPTEAQRRGLNRHAMCPDFFFVLYRRDIDSHLPCVGEADRSTMTHERFSEKVTNYLAWKRLGRCRRVLGFVDFLVLTVTVNNPTNSENLRRDNLREAVRMPVVDADEVSMFRFALQDDYLNADPKSFVGKIWYLAASRGRPKSGIPEDPWYRKTVNLFQ